MPHCPDERFRESVVAVPSTGVWTRLCTKQPGRKVLGFCASRHVHIRPFFGSAPFTEGFRLTRSDLISIDAYTITGTAVGSAVASGLPGPDYDITIDPITLNSDGFTGSIHVKENWFLFWRDWGPVIEQEFYARNTVAGANLYVFECIYDG